MLGTRIVLNEEKILRENIYSLQEMYDLIDKRANELDFIKEDKYTYIAKDDKDALSNMGLLCFNYLMKLDWFISNLTEWIFIDSEEGNSDLLQDLIDEGKLGA